MHLPSDHLPPARSRNVGAFCVCATEASSKHPLTPYAAPHRPREPRAAGPTCQQKDAKSSGRRKAFTATVLSHACGSLMRDLIERSLWWSAMHRTAPGRTVTNSVVCVLCSGQGLPACPEGRMGTANQSAAIRQSGSSSGIVPTGRYNTNLIPNYSR